MSKTDPMWVFENYGEAAELIDEHEAVIAQQATRIAELEAENERFVEALEVAAGKAVTERENLREELAALKAQPSGVVLPERRILYARYTPHQKGEASGFNTCLDEVARLNHCRAQAVPDGYVLVPVEPTEIMQDAGCAAMPTADCHPYDAGMVYKAMLAANPCAKEESGDE